MLSPGKIGDIAQAALVHVQFEHRMITQKSLRKPQWLAGAGLERVRAPGGPPHGWFECKVALGDNSCLTTTDPINFELYKPGGGAIEAVRQAFVAAGRWGLVAAGCFNPLVHFDAGRGLGQPDDVWATDISNDGCGSGPRNHVHLWEGPGDTVVYGRVALVQVG